MYGRLTKDVKYRDIYIYIYIYIFGCYRFSNYTVITNHYGGSLHSKFHDSQSNDKLVRRWMLVITNKYLIICLEIK